MAGLAKPNVSDLGREISIVILSYTGRSSANSLFDGVLTGEKTPNSPTTSYWYANDYIEFITHSEVNIWRCGTSAYPQDCAKFDIYKYENNTYVNVTELVTQRTTAINNTKWEKTIETLQEGRYKFVVPSGYRADSEWYIEGNNFVLLKQNNKYYSINPEYYNPELQQYAPLVSIDFETGGFGTSSLFNEVTINEETFIPIDKFKNFSLVINNAYANFNLRAIPTTKQLIVANDDIYTSVANNIDYFNLLSNVSENSSLKLALSIDSGATWKIWNTTSLLFEDLIDCVIPLKPYELLTVNELTQWNIAMDNIHENGIAPDVFNTLDFNLLDADYIRFAYVLSRPNYNDIAETLQLDWQFDAKGHFEKMKDTEYKLELYEKQIKITSSINNPIIKANIII